MHVTFSRRAPMHVTFSRDPKGSARADLILGDTGALGWAITLKMNHGSTGKLYPLFRASGGHVVRRVPDGSTRG